MSVFFVGCLEDPNFKPNFSFLYPLKFKFTESELGRTYYYRMTATGYDTLTYNATFAQYDQQIEEEFGFWFYNFFLKEAEFLSDTSVRLLIEDPTELEEPYEAVIPYRYRAAENDIRMGSEEEGYFDVNRNEDFTRLTYHGVMYTFNYFDDFYNHREFAPFSITYYDTTDPKAILDSIRNFHLKR